MTFETFQVQTAARLLANGRFEGVAVGVDAAVALAPGLPGKAATVQGLQMQQAVAAQYAQDHFCAGHAGIPRQGR